MTQHTHSSMIDTERIGFCLLKLEGIDLLESAVLTLHQTFGTQYTNIIEKILSRPNDTFGDCAIRPRTA
ncbi:hypothetical protein BCS63_022670 [Vibrio cyclitrophicus]